LGGPSISNEELKKNNHFKKPTPVQMTENWRAFDFKNILKLYESVNWIAYTEKPVELKLAFENSSYILLAIQNEQVVGALRSLSDGVSVHYLQDILVSPSYQRKGIGRQVLEMALSRYAHVRAHLLLTDDEETQHAFYKSLGYKNVREYSNPALNSFLKLKKQ